MALPTQLVDHYEVLGVAHSASEDEIRQRYRFLALAFHPDRYRRNSEHHHQAEQQIKRVNEAYRVLSDPQLRAAFDAARRPYGSVEIGSVRSSSSVYAQSLQEMARATQRLQKVEQDLLKTRERLEQSERIRVKLDARLAEFEQLRAGEQASSDTAQKALLSRVDMLTQERLAVERSLQEKLERAERKIARLLQEVERKTNLVERLNHAKAQWEASSQSRIDMLNQRVERLRAERKERERQLAEAVGGRRILQEQMTQEQRSARHTMQNYSSALSASETEAARLQIELDALSAIQERSRAIARLWQFAAIIGIVNTIILLILVLQRLSGG